MHGAKTPVVKAAAERRIALKQAFERGDRRPPWQILADTLHAADVLMVDSRVRLLEGEAVTVAELDRFIDALERAQRFAKTFLDAGIDERRMRASEAATLQLIGLVQRAMATVGLTQPQQAQLRKALSAEIRAAREAA
jgi:hypothetical protein